MMRSALVALSAAVSVIAHGGVTGIVIGGTNYVGWSPYQSASNQTSIERPYTTYDPIYSAASASISCNNNGQKGPQQQTATVAAGTSITAKWSQWTHMEGPVTVYMGSCGGSCDSANSGSLSWFKIAETGLKSGTIGNGTWGNGDVLKNLQYTTTIPSALAAGNYLIRWELMAIHQANTPQFYPECAQLTVTGGGGQTPSGSYLAKFPGTISDNDPYVHIDIYQGSLKGDTVYKVPGPPVWTGGSGGPSTPAGPTTRPPATTPPTPTSSAPQAAQTKYGQCGGTGWTGPTTCVSGSTCTAVNQYYSQCT